MADSTSGALAQANVPDLNNSTSSSLTQGAPAPNILTSQTSATSLDPYYADMTQNLAQYGGDAALNAQFAGPTANQNLAFNNAQALTGSQTYQPYLTAAATTLQNLQGKSALSSAQPYLTDATANSPLSAGSGLINQGANANLVGTAQPYVNAATSANQVGAFNPYATAATQQTGLAAANPYLQAGTQSSASNVGQYMNPYQSNVINQLQTLGQQNINQNIVPQSNAGAIASGQFGSQRGEQVLGQSLADANTALNAQIANQLSTGYGQALTASQQGLQNQLTAAQTAGGIQQQQAGLLGQLGATAGNLTGQQAQTQLAGGQLLGNLANQQAQNQITGGMDLGTLQNLGNQTNLTAAQTSGQLSASDMASQIAQAQAGSNLGTTQQALGLNNLNALSTLGAQQQQIQQNQNLFPQTQAQSYANLLGSLSKPTSSTQITNAPASVYQPSGLATVGGALSLANAGLNLYNSLPSN